ncbi:hypothetical protein AVEN_53423-1 [Araneus ventricosus]|uniref:Reverse transcriptase domain-containing protein n=1 Tax=Araneus ventricosus TaxID=182803 RepID=A0A4Y2AAZ2_ARAVE|nr:hypothetical protein AVEN_53423-1 [Araneus ventricosus]
MTRLPLISIGVRFKIHLRAFIMNLLWKAGVLPKQWKTAVIIPVRKPNKDASSVESYRPIALTCIPCKLKERIILRRITHHLMVLNLIPEEQYGFRRGHSTIDQILYFAQSVRDAHNMKPTNHTITVFLDFTKAFDKWTSNQRLKKDSSIGVVWKRGFLDFNIEPCIPFGCLTPTTPLDKVSFNDQLLTSASKHTQHPEMIRQLSLEVINNIPSQTLVLCTDGSKLDSDRTGSGVYARAEDGLVFRCRFRNPENFSVFRSELLAIRKALDFALRFETSDTYILTDSKSSIQYLKNWPKISEKPDKKLFPKLFHFHRKAEFAFNGFHPMLESSATRWRTCLRKREVLFLLPPLVNSSRPTYFLFTGLKQILLGKSLPHTNGMWKSSWTVSTVRRYKIRTDCIDQIS